MIKDITVGQYILGKSYLHRADPRLKIALTFIYMTVIMFVNSYTGLAMLWMFTLAVIVTSGIPLKYTLKGLKPVLLIIVFTSVFNIFMTKGTPVFEYGFIHVTYEGLDFTAKMALRITLLVTGASLLTLTTTPIMLTDGIEILMGPMKRLRVPVHEIAMMMTIALRFIPTLLEEADKIIKAQASRGADFDTGGIMQKAKSFIPVLVPLIVSAFRRAEELADAMEARCYKGGEGRTRMRQMRLSIVDIWICAVVVLFFAVLLYMQIAV